jgi:sulfatase maturation enzyme AslB (radical SAM superfamily)
LCNGGCSYNRYAKRKLFTDLNTFCKANKMVFTHIEKVLQNSTNKFFNKEYPFTLAFQSNKNKYD